MLLKDKIGKILDKIHTPNWLTALLVLVIVLRIPTFFEPFHYGDEMIYLTLGEGIRKGIPLYLGLHDNKPPLLYIMAAIAGNVFWFRVILAFWSLATIVLFWHLVKALFPKKIVLHKVATLIFAILTTIPLLEGNIPNSELFMIGPVIAAFLILLTKKLVPKNLLFAGFLFSIAALFKLPAAFDLPAILVLWLVVMKFRSVDIKKFVKRTSILLLGFAIPIAVTIAWYYFRGALNEYIFAAFAQNIGYLSSWREGGIIVQEPFLARNGPLLIRVGIVILGIAALFVYRKKLSPEFIFLTAWLLLTLFAVTLSERPYPHYLIQSVPPLSIMLAIFFTQKNLEQSLTIIPLALAFFAPVYYKFWYYPTASYYANFIQFAKGDISKEEYFSKFSKKVNRNYEVAEFLVSSSQPSDKIFVWSPNSPTIYALSRRLPPIRYIADYHINDFSSKEEVVGQLEVEKPKFIVITPERSFPEIVSLLRTDYLLIESIDDAEIWSHIDFPTMPGE